MGLLRLAALTDDDALPATRAEAIVRLLGRAGAAGTPRRSATCSAPSTSWRAAPPRSSSPATGPTWSPRSSGAGSPDAGAGLGRAPTSSPLWEGRTETGADGRAYVCRGYVCGLPADDVDTLTAQLA